MSTSTSSRDVAPGSVRAEVTESPNYSKRWWVLVVAALAQLVVVLDATVVNIALPTAQADLGFSNDNRQWIVTGYALAFGSLLLVGGRLSDLLGRRLMFIIGLLGFGAASALGGAANSFELLVSARVLQGVFGAMLAPAGLSLLTTTFTDAKERARALSIYGAIAGAGGAVGLILGGALTEYLSWRWCLLVNVPIVIIAVVSALAVVKGGGRSTTSTGIDVPGAVLSVLGLVGIVYGLATAETEGWSSPLTLVLIAVGLVLLAVFVVVEQRVEHPLLPIRIVLDRARGGALVALASAGAGMFGVFLFLTYYLSTALAYTPLKTGVAFLPMIGGITIAAQFAPWAVRKLGLKITISTGMLAAAIGMWMLTGLTLTSSYASHVLPALVLTGIGIGWALVPSISAATAGVQSSDAGVASAMTNTMQQVGGSIGTAVLSAFAASAATDYLAANDASNPLVQAQSAIESYTTAFWWSAGIFAAGALVLAFLLPMRAVEPDPDAPPVMMH